MTLGAQTTLAKMRAGSAAFKWVLLLEGVPYIISDSDNESAAQSAYAGTDFETMPLISGLFVELQNSQSLDLLEPFSISGSCNIRVLDTDRSDTFAIFVNRRLAGGETMITGTIDRDDATINVASTTGFASSGTVYIGTEAIKYSGVTATSFTGCTRGYLSPLGCTDSGSGAGRFPNHHRKGLDPNHVMMQPLVTQFPRTWIGKRMVLRMHTVDGDGTLNDKDDAQIVFAGRLVGIADDPNDFSVVMDFDHANQEFQDAAVGKDLHRAEISPGISLVAGRIFTFGDWKDGSAFFTPTDLTVVASGATAPYEVNAGRYDGDELCSILSQWLGAAKAAGTIHGYYTWAYGVQTSSGIRTRVHWRIEDAGTISCEWRLTMPGEIGAFLGFTVQDGDPRSQQVGLVSKGKTTNRSVPFDSDLVPYHSMVFRPFAPGHSQEYGDALTYELENEQGAFIDQYATFPTVIKASVDADHQWGMWLLEEKTLVVGAYSTVGGTSTLDKCWLAQIQFSSDSTDAAPPFSGRRLDETSGGPITIRQVLIIETTFANALLSMVHSTGTSGLNHSTYDSYGYGIGIAIPGELLGDEFIRSVTNLPQAYAPFTAVIEESKKFIDVFAADLRIRGAYVRWKDQHFELGTWKTPTSEDAVAALTESNKAAPSGQQDNHRIAAQEVLGDQHPIIKVDYGRNFASGRDDKYERSVTLEDQVVVDDMGGNVKPLTLKMVNSYTGLAGADMESLLSHLLTIMPIISRPWRSITRSIDMRYWEGYGVGDIVTVTDSFARDPLTGRRGISARPAMILKLSYNPGGPSTDGTVRPMGGDVVLGFLDIHRGGKYASAAEIDSTVATGGFSGGYNSGTKTIRCITNKYSHSISYGTKRLGVLSSTDAADASRFSVGDKVTVYEIDPSSSGSYLSWDDTILTVSGNDLGLTTGLAGFDTSKKYRITYDRYSDVTTGQQDYAFQADSTDGLIQDLDPAFHFSVTDELFNFSANPSEKTELLADIAYGDGRPLDPGADRALANTLNRFYDYKSAVQCPTLVTSSPGNSGDWTVVMAGLYWFGMDQPGATVSRPLVVAPRFRSSNGAAAAVRVTMSRLLPTAPPSDVQGLADMFEFTDFGLYYSQSSTWSTSSTTWQDGAPAQLDMSVKDLWWGMCWLTIETQDFAQVRGLSTCYEGPRTLP